MNKIILSGANGFLGHSLIPELLKNGYEVHAVSRDHQQASSPAVVWHKLDLADSAGVLRLCESIKANTLIHGAWYTTHGLFWESEENLDWVSRSLNLVKSFVSSGGRRVVGIGSCAEYDWGEPVCSEDSTPLNPRSFYGVCKNATQTLLNEFCSKSGVSFTWPRLFWLFGPHENQSRLLPSLINSVVQKKFIELNDTTCKRDFLFIEEAANAIANLTLSELQGPINISSGEGVEIGEFVGHVTDYCGGEEYIGFKSESDRQPSVSLIGSNNRLRTELGWEAGATFKNQLEKAIDWHISHIQEA